MIKEQLKKHRLSILIVFLAGLTLFSLSRYLFLARENAYLYHNLKQISKQIDSLQTQRQNLLQTIEKQNQESSAIKDSLKANLDKLGRMEADFIQARRTTEELNAMVSSLKAENANLNDQSQSLKAQLSQVSQEKESLQAKLNSLDELKRAIRDLKIKMRQAKRGLPEKNNPSVTGDGNRGFIIKNGKPTYPAKVIIEVRPTH